MKTQKEEKQDLCTRRDEILEIASEVAKEIHGVLVEPSTRDPMDLTRYMAAYSTLLKRAAQVDLLIGLSKVSITD